MQSRHAQDDLILVSALARYSHDFERSELRNAERASQMAREISHQHGLDPAEAVLQLESR